MNTDRLPIHALDTQIVSTLRGSNRLILTAPTGSGKTTQVPQILWRARLFDGQIIILQPRRLAARMLAHRVAAEMAVPIGGLVGYQTRHDSKAGPQTMIRFMTEGLFLRLLQSNPGLSGVSAVILDEFHERNLATDTALALLKRLQESTRSHLRLIVMSATIDTRRLSEYLACPILEAHGRLHPVQIRYLERSARADPWELAADAVADILDRGEPGDVLIFMPGAYEIRRTIELVQRHDHAADPLSILPLHSELPPRQQDAALAPAPNRKVIVSTNIAETSITIDGIRHVIDSGLARVNRFDPRRGINVLMVEPISQASAEQRAGRAGRTAPGACTRLWTELEQRRRPFHDTPEIQRLDLAEVVLQLKFHGIEDLAAFPWLEPPNPFALQQAHHLLVELGALDTAGSLTPRGSQMARLPMHPRLSRLLIQAAARRCLPPAALWAALISERDILLRNTPHHFADDLPPSPRSDFLVLERAFQAASTAGFDPNRCAAIGVSALACRDIEKTRRLYIQASADAGLDTSAPRHPADPSCRLPDLASSLLAAFPDHLAMRRNDANLACALAGQRRGTLDPQSVAQRPGLILPVEIREIGAGQNVRTVLSLVTEIELDWLYEAHADSILEERHTFFNLRTGAVETVDREIFDELVINESPPRDPDPAAAAEILADEIIKGNLKLERWDQQVEQWIARTRCVADWFPERRLIRYEPDELRLIIQEVCAGATRYRQIRDRPCLEHVKNALSWEDRQFVEQMAPDRIQLPRGWRMKVEYTPGLPPRGRAKIQDLYDLVETPAVAGGRAKLLLEILGPNFRPVQVTDDLPRFWNHLYPTLRKELARRYPRHEWR